MKAYLVLSVTALFLTVATPAAIEGATETGIAMAPPKTSLTTNLHPRAPSTAAAQVEAFTKTGIAVAPHKTGDIRSLSFHIPDPSAEVEEVEAQTPTTDTSKASAPDKTGATTAASTLHPRAPSAVAETLTESGLISPAQKTSNVLSHTLSLPIRAKPQKCNNASPGCSKCTECCVFRLRSRQWVPPDTTVVLSPGLPYDRYDNSGCYAVPIEGQYDMVTTECTDWFGTCIMWPQRDCTGEHMKPFDVHGDLGTWWGSAFWVRGISCQRNESWVG